MLTTEQISAFRSRVPQAIEQELMSKHTSFRLGGPARLYVVANSSDEVWAYVSAARDLGIPWYVFGGGSNLLVSDQGFEGVMIQAAHRKIEIDGTVVRVESGALSVLVSKQSVEAGLTGFEWAAGLPGTIGGAIYGNAGCFGGDMAESVMRVDAWRMRDGVRVSLTNQECQFDYRDSFFKREPHLILGCELQLQQTPNIEASRERITKILSARKSDQPMGSMSAGCIFKNPKVEQRDIDFLLQKGYTPMFGHDSKQYLSAGWLIEMAGVKGQKIGNVRVSEKHGNFFLTDGVARAEDVIALISLVKMHVRDDLGIQLHEEVQYVGF